LEEIRARLSSEKVFDNGRTTVGDICGRMSTESWSWYACDFGLIGGEWGGMGVHVVESLLRQLEFC
jgi:hypothetical protein